MLSALWQDEEILVIDKPAGLPTQPGAGIKVSLVEAVERDFGFRPYLVHRLDRETAGCIIVARDSKAASKWSEMIAGREVGKYYRAVVAGAPPADEGKLDSPVKVRGESKSSHARWRLVGSFGKPGQADSPQSRPEEGSMGRTGPYSLLELELGTGRTHQLRLQLSALRMPILGDDSHGDFRLNKDLRRAVGLKRLLLLSWRLVLPGRRAIEAAEPSHFVDFLTAFSDSPAWERPG